MSKYRAVQTTKRDFPQKGICCLCQCPKMFCHSKLKAHNTVNNLFTFSRYANIREKTIKDVT